MPLLRRRRRRWATKKNKVKDYKHCKLHGFSCLLCSCKYRAVRLLAHHFARHQPVTTDVTRYFSSNVYFLRIAHYAVACGFSFNQQHFNRKIRFYDESVVFNSLTLTRLMCVWARARARMCLFFLLLCPISFSLASTCSVSAVCGVLATIELMLGMCVCAFSISKPNGFGADFSTAHACLVV